MWITPLWRGVLLTLECCGAGVILDWGVPFYRDLLTGNFSRADHLAKLGMIASVARAHRIPTPVPHAAAIIDLPATGHEGLTNGPQQAARQNQRENISRETNKT